MNMILRTAALLIFVTGCDRPTSEAKIFNRFGLPAEVEVVATAQGRQGFNVWMLRTPAGFPIDQRIKWPSEYKQDPNVLMASGPDCASELLDVASACRTQPLAVKVGPGGRHGHCTISLDKLLQPPMTSHGKQVEFAQLTIDC
jgi:hypothetical protein